MNEFTHLDLFSGIGGFSVAFEAAGFRTIAFSEVDPYACAVLKRRWPGTPNLGDVRKLCRRAYDCVPDSRINNDWSESQEPWCRRCQNWFGDCECVGTDQFTDTYGFPSVVTAGFPCQDISVAFNCGGKGKYNRKAKGLKGKRSGLFYEIPRILEELGRPIFFLGENVPNLRTKGADAVLSELEAIGYAAQTFVVGAGDFGAEHKRKRVLILAYAKGFGVEGLRPTWEQVAQPLALPFLPLRDSDGVWKIEPDLRRANDGLPGWIHRVRCVGNSVSPQVIFPFAEIIRQSLTQLQKTK